MVCGASYWMGSLLDVITVRTVKAAAMSVTEFMSNEHRSAIQKADCMAHNALPAADVIEIRALKDRPIGPEADIKR